MSTITLMFKKIIIKKIGFFDSVRFSADDEFIHRIYTIYGRKRVKLLKRILYFAIIRSNSLTQNKRTGFKTNYRSQYWNACINWHAKNRNRKNKLKINFPLKKRLFFAPKIMLS